MLSWERIWSFTAFIYCWERYLQAGMWNFICFDKLWEVFSERCFEKAQCHLPSILFWDLQDVQGKEQTVFQDLVQKSAALFWAAGVQNVLSEASLLPVSFSPPLPSSLFSFFLYSIPQFFPEALCSFLPFLPLSLLPPFPSSFPPSIPPSFPTSLPSLLPFYNEYSYNIFYRIYRIIII